MGAIFKSPPGSSYLYNWFMKHIPPEYAKAIKDEETAKNDPQSNIIAPMWHLMTDRHIYWDFVGVLHPFRASSLVLYQESEKFLERTIEGEPIWTQPPSVMLQGLINRRLKPEYQHVLTAVTSTFEFEQSKAYVMDNYPGIPENHIYGVSRAEYKPLVIKKQHEMRQRNADKSEEIKVPLLIDDTVDTLRAVEKLGFLSLHVSSLLP